MRSNKKTLEKVIEKVLFILEFHLNKKEKIK